MGLKRVCNFKWSKSIKSLTYYEQINFKMLEDTGSWCSLARTCSFFFLVVGYLEAEFFESAEACVLEGL